MRIISGTARGRKLKEPRGFEIRPTSDMVKESLFNIVQFDIEGRRVLDLFAGTGQLGLEALSRGAKSVVFVDQSPDASALIKENLKLCAFPDGTAAVYTRDALDYIRGMDEYDLIFIDPPYDTKLMREAVRKIIEFDKLRENGIIVCETRADSAAPAAQLPYQLLKEYRYGGIKLVKYVKTCGDGADS